MSEFRPISFDVSNVGRTIKRTKKKFCWKFLMDDEPYEINVYFSRLSGKLKILLNGEIQINTYRYVSTKTDYRVHVGKHTISIADLGPVKFELMYKGKTFSLLVSEESSQSLSRESSKLKKSPPVLNIQESNIDGDMLKPSTSRNVDSQYSDPFQSSLELNKSSSMSRFPQHQSLNLYRNDGFSSSQMPEMMVSDMPGFHTLSSNARSSNMLEKHRHSLQPAQKDTEEYKNLTSARYNPFE